MKKILRNTFLFVLLFSMIIICGEGCKAFKKNFSEDEKPRKKERVKSAFEANLDDELNATERKAVDPILEEGEKEHRRNEKDVFGIPF